MTFISHFDKLQIYPYLFPGFRNFHVLNLNYTYKIPINMLKTTMVYFGVLQQLLPLHRLVQLGVKEGRVTSKGLRPIILRHSRGGGGLGSDGGRPLVLTYREDIRGHGDHL